mmetsp:Transcript_48086/g.120464  ORF Transcript_48086/g.120464 Transcript_48086/m.120464 type:complete len:687 (-) Transcript_48086:137-2197(-)
MHGSRARSVAGLMAVALLAALAVEAQQPACVDDGQPPTITALSIKPGQWGLVNVTTGEAAPVSVNFTVTDAGAPIELCSAALRSPDRQHPQFVVLAPAGDNPRSCSADGRTCSMSLMGMVKPNVVSGRWSMELSCRDDACEDNGPKNDFVLAGEQLVALGFPGHVEVVSGRPDVAPPEMRGFRFVEAGSTTETLDTVFVQDGPRTVGLFYTVTDDVSGIESCLVTLRSPDAAVRATFTGTEDCTPDRRRCTFTQSTTLQSNSPSGAWEPVVFCRDAVGNKVLFSSDDLDRAGFPFRLNVVTLVPDNTPPELLQFSFNPPQVNIAAGPATVEVNMVVLDVESVLADCSVMFHSPDGQQVGVGLSGGQSCSSDYQRCVYSKTVRIPAAGAPGTWRPTVLCGDVLQNRMVWGPTLLADAGFASVLHVRDAAADTAPPALQAVDLSPRTLDVAYSDARVTVSVDVSDGGSAIDGCIGVLHGPRQQSAALATTAARCASPSACVYTMAGTLPQGAAPGRWELSLACRDTPGNGFAYWPDELRQRGFQPSLLVVAAEREDSVAPQLVSFELGSRRVQVEGADGAPVEATLTVTDSGKNIAGCAVVLLDGTGNLVFLDGEPACSVDALRQSCLFFLRGRVPAGAAPGEWRAAVSCSDASGNSLNMNADQLTAAGQDSRLEVLGGVSAQWAGKP